MRGGAAGVEHGSMRNGGLARHKLLIAPYSRGECGALRDLLRGRGSLEFNSRKPPTLRATLLCM